MLKMQIKAMRDDAFPPDGYHALIDSGHVDEEGAWFPTEGAKRVHNMGAGEDVINLFEWVRRGNQRWLIIERIEDDETTSIYYYNWQTQAITLITTRRFSPAAPVGSTFLPLGTWLYILSPGDTAVRWDGQRIEQVGFQVPAAPVASGPGGGFTAYDSLAAADDYSLRKDPVKQRGVGPYPDTETDIDQPWRIGWALTWLNAVGSESPRSPLSITSGTNLVDAEFGRNAVFVQIPPGPPGAVAGRLWRTQNLQDVSEPVAATVYLVDEFAHAAGHSYIDIATDGELNTLLDEDELGVPPSQPYTGTFWAGFLWLVDGDDRSLIHRSSLLLQEQFPDANYVIAGSAHSGDIVALVPTQRSMLIFKQRGIYALSDPDGAPLVISESHGTDASKAIVVVPGEGVFYLDTHGGPSIVYGTMHDEQNTGIKTIPGIRRTWRRHVGQRLECARVLYDPKNREVWWSVPKGGNNKNGMSLVYHLGAEGWSIRDNWPVDSMVLFSTGHIFVGSRQLQPGLDILTYGEDGRDASAAAVELTLHTQWVETAAETVFMVGELLVEGIGNVTIDVNSRADRRPVDIDQAESGRQLVQPDHDRDQWSVGVWGSAYQWVENDPARIPIDLHNRSSAHSYQLRLAGSRLKVYSVIIYNEEERSLPYRRERYGGSLP